MVAPGGADAAFVADYGGNAVYKIPRGFVGTADLKTAGAIKWTGFSFPSDVEADDKGEYVFVSDSAEVRRFTFGGELLTEYKDFVLPWAAAADPAREAAP